MEMEMEMEMEENLLNSLPFEIKLNIYSRLPVDSVLACRRVCKAWNNVFLDSQNHTYFAYLHLRCNGDGLIDQKPQQLNSESKMLNFVFIKRHNLYYAEYLKEDKDGKQKLKFHKRMINLSIPLDVTGHVSSCNGLICLSSNSSGKTNEPAYICNPITRELVNLSRITMGKYDGISFVHGFGYYRLTDKYKVVRISYAYNIKLRPYDPARRSGRMYRSYSRGQVDVYTLGSGEWRNLGETSYRVLSHYADDAVGSVCVNGSIHWLNGEEIVAINLADEKFCSLPTPPGLAPHTTRNLYVLNGFLCLACKNLGEGSFDIWFLKKNMQGDRSTLSYEKERYASYSWSKEFNIGIAIGFEYQYPKLFCLTDREAIIINNCGHMLRYSLETTASEKTWRCTHRGTKSIPLPLLHINSFVSMRALGEENVKIFIGSSDDDSYRLTPCLFAPDSSESSGSESSVSE